MTTNQTTCPFQADQEDIKAQETRGLMTNVKKVETEEDSTTKEKCKTFLRQNVITILMFLAVVIGISLGVGLKQMGDEVWTKRNIMYLSFPGELFLRMLKGLILPLIFSSLVAAIGSLDIKLSAKIGVRSIIYYIVTTLLAVILGIVLVISIRPGKGGKVDNKESLKSMPSTTPDTLLDLVRNMFPPNVAEATMFQYRTELQRPENVSENNTDFLSWHFKAGKAASSNILGIVVFAVVLGIAIGIMKEEGRPLLHFFSSLGNAMMIITKWVIWISPIGLIFLVAGKILAMESLTDVVGQVGYYTMTVLAGLCIHALIVLPLIYFIIVRKQPFGFIGNMAQALATAFGTSSSSATLPVTITCLEEKNDIDPRVSRFCLPIGATINMDGTALYEAVAAIFIAQVRNVPLDMGKIIAISITATAASIGAAGIPQAGLVTMVMVLNAVGLPGDDIALILVVDWLLDRFRTTVNVLGDSLGAGIVSHLSRKDLELPLKGEIKDASNELTTYSQEFTNEANILNTDVTSM